MQINFFLDHSSVLRAHVFSDSLVAVYYSREYKFLVAGHSDVASFENCRSSANLFAALQMNEVKFMKTSPLNWTFVD